MTSFVGMGQKKQLNKMKRNFLSQSSAVPSMHNSTSPPRSYDMDPNSAHDRESKVQEGVHKTLDSYHDPNTLVFGLNGPLYYDEANLQNVIASPYGFQNNAFEAEDQLTGRPIQQYFDGASSQPGSFSFDNNADFDNENVGRYGGSKQCGQANSILEVNTDSATDLALPSMGEQPGIIGQATEQHGTVEHNEVVQSFLEEQDFGWNHRSSQIIEVPAVPYAASQLTQAQPQGRGSGEFRIEAKHLHPGHPIISMANNQPYAQITQTSFNPSIYLPHASMGPAQSQTVNYPVQTAIAPAVPQPHNQMSSSLNHHASELKKLKINSLPPRPYTKDDFKGCRRTGKKLENGDWDIHTKRNFYDAFLRYHRRPTLPAKDPNGLTEFTQRSYAIKNLDDSDKILLSDFTKAGKYFQKYKKLPNPPNVVLVSDNLNGNDGDESDDESEPFDQDVTDGEYDRVNQSGKYKLTAPEKRARNEEEGEESKVAAPELALPKKKVRTSACPHNTQHSKTATKGAKFRPVLANYEALGRLLASEHQPSIFEIVEKYLAANGQPSILEISNKHLTSNGCRTVRFFDMTGPAFPAPGCPAAGNVNEAAAQGHDQRTSDAEMVSQQYHGTLQKPHCVASTQARLNTPFPGIASAGHRSSTLGKRKAHTENEGQDSDSEVVAPVLKKIRDGYAKKAALESSRRLTSAGNQKASLKRRPVCKGKQMATKAPTAHYSHRSPTFEPSDHNAFTPSSINLAEGSGMGGNGHPASHGYFDSIGNYLEFDRSNYYSAVNHVNQYGASPPGNGKHLYSDDYGYQHPSAILDGSQNDMAFEPWNQFHTSADGDSEGSPSLGLQSTNNGGQASSNAEESEDEKLLRELLLTELSAPEPQSSEGFGDSSQEAHPPVNSNDNFADEVFDFESDLPRARW